MTSNMNSFAKASLLLAFVSIMLANTIVFPVMFGSLSIIFAVLSKESEKQMSKPMVATVALSSISMVIAVAYLGYGVYMYKNDPEFRANINQQYQDIYGVSLDEYLSDIYSDSLAPESNSVVQ